MFDDRNAWGKIQPLVCIDAANQYTVGEELTSGSKNIRQISGIKSCHTSLKGLFFKTTLHISESSLCVSMKVVGVPEYPGPVQSSLMDAWCF